MCGEVRRDEVRRQKTPKRLQCSTANDAMRFAARLDVIAVPGAADASLSTSTSLLLQSNSKKMDLIKYMLVCMCVCECVRVRECLPTMRTQWNSESMT